MELLDLIPEGKLKAISRERLAELSGLSDRRMREAIAQLRDDGAVILNDQDGRGYYKSVDLNEIEHHYWAERSRALAVLKRLKTVRRMLRDAGVDVNRKGGNHDE